MSGVPHTHMHQNLSSSTSSWRPIPSPTRSRFSVFQTAQGWSWPVARHSSRAMPLSFRRAAWLSRLFHFSCHSAFLAVAGEVSRATLVSRKLCLDGSRFRAAVCPWSRCRVSVTCFLRSAFVITVLRMSGGGGTREGIKAVHRCGFDAASGIPIKWNIRQNT